MEDPRRITHSGGRSKGFTLIEVMVVVAIIGILAAVLVPQVGKMIDKGKVARAKGDVRSIANAIHQLYIDTGEYPGRYHGESLGYAVCSCKISECSICPGATTYTINDPEAGLLRTDGNYTNWDGPYLDKEIPKFDPWGGIYFYERSSPTWAETYCGFKRPIRAVWSYGPNKKTDTGTERCSLSAGGDDIIIYLE